MRYRLQLFLMITVLLFSCKKEGGSFDTPPAPHVALLKDILIPNLPSPYYHFEYDAGGKVKFTSFASDLTRYDVVYDGNRISEMRNFTLVNKDRLEYLYDTGGRVFMIQYVDSNGVAFTRSFFTYDGQKLIKAERLHTEPGGFIIDRTMTMTYTADGNLLELTDHRPAINGQTETTFVVRFEQYDDKTNVDGFTLLHPDFFEHFFLLPGVQLQKNNPGKETGTGNDMSYQVNYTYTYSSDDVPLTKKGELTFSSGPLTGRTYELNSTYTYY